jgi:DNA-binding NarL/FixJ family response regulator
LIALRRNFAAARYLVVGHDRSQDDVMRMVQLGADGFIPYQHVADNLIRAVHAIAAGQLWVDARTLTRLLKSNGRGVVSINPAVTFRESQILELAKGRLTNKEIGSVLGIQESTVKYHLTNLFAKLRVSSRDDLLENPDPTGCWRRLLQPTHVHTASAESATGYSHALYGKLRKTGS